jgi:predicted AlkP superfamily pyrophosphatase or phosphodiesterase
MTLVILGLDALDHALVEYFDMDEYMLERYGELKTFANMKEVPYTPEVWASVATGLRPKSHGVTDAGTSEWSSPTLDFFSNFTGHLPVHVRGRLGDFIRSYTNAEYELRPTNQPTIFDGDGRVVHTWPGAGPTKDLIKLWDLLSPDEEEQTRGEFERVIFEAGVQQIAWAKEMLNHNVVLAGVHVHTLDICGHAYGMEKENYRRIYRRVGEWVEEVRSALGNDDELLVVSDHGMETSFCRPEPGAGMPREHSFRAFVSSTIDDELPETVFDVKDWVEDHVEAYQEASEEDLDLPMDTLRDLGYIQ